MNKAIREAKRTYASFLNTFEKPGDDKSDFAVKLKFACDTEGVEHMWLNYLHHRGEKMFGILENDPVDVSRVKAGDTLQVIKDSVTDWMFLENNKLIGGYTIRVLYKKMSKKEKEQFKKEISFEIE